MPSNSIDDRETCDATRAPGVQPLPPGIAVGTDLVVRGRRWRLAAMVARDDCAELHLSADGRRHPLILLWPFDRPAAADARRVLRAIRLRAWASALRRHAAATIDPATPRGVPRAVDLIPYQLAPALAMAAGASRLLLADEVGLGKTIQAGWIVSDLVARHPDARVLLAVPAAVKRQWIEELSGRFGIEAAAVDARWLRAMVADLPADVSPWAAPGVYAGSLDFLKREDIAASLRVQAWDLLVVDEAHTATAPTERHAALALIASRARRVVTITATPYSGDAASFASMASLGSTGGDPPPVMFRRSREDVGDPRRRRHRFAAVRITRAEARLQRLLERYSRRVWNEASSDAGAARLAVTILRKRALSSPGAAARSLRRRLELLSSRAPAPRQLGLFDDEEVDDDLPAAALAAPGLADAALEERWLGTLVDAADAAAGRDSKRLFLQRLLRRLRGESAVVFTEYRDTLLQLASGLPPAMQLHGGLTAAERADVQARFNRDGGLLLATDAAAEGLNLHGRCRFVVNYELPWNPGRLEQRIGRVDRIGQARTVHAVTLTARDTAEDLVIRNLARRLARVVATLGADDRLSAFLDEARTARVVIGGAPLDADPDAGACDAMVVRAPAVSEPAIDAAALLRRARPSSRNARRPRSTDIVVARMRASGRVRPGFIVVTSCSARTGEGTAIARNVRVTHVAACPAKPATARAARAGAAALLHALPDIRTIDAEVDRWFGGAGRAHDAAVESALIRERFLRDRRATHGEIQPGLFDRRALHAAEREAGRDAALAAEHQRQIEALERSRPLHLVCEPVAVLIAWR